MAIDAKQRPGRPGPGTGEALRRPRRKGGGRARRRPRDPRRRDLRLPGPQRRGQVDDRADAHDAADDHRRPRRGGRRGRRRRPGRRAPPDRRRASRGGPRSPADRARAADHARAAVRLRPRRGQAARAGPDHAGRARRRCGPRDQGLLRRHAAPARPRGRARGPAGGAVPRRADHRPRPGKPADGVGGAAPDQRRGHHGVPHDAVPRGGRPALRPDRDHRRRAHRVRGTPQALKDVCAGAAAATRSPRSTTCSSTRPGAHATAPRARCRRWPHERHAHAGTARAARGDPAARRALHDDVHPDLLPGGEHRPGRRDLPVGHDRVPGGPGIRRVPAADHAAAGGLVRHGGVVPGRGDRGRLLRQAAGDADPALRDGARPAGRGGREVRRDRVGDRADRAAVRDHDRERAARASSCSSG